MNGGITARSLPIEATVAGKATLSAAAVLAGHSPGTPACATAGGSSDAHAIHSVHARSTCLPDFDDHIIRHLQRCKRHGLNLRRQHQRRCRNYPSDHCISPIERSALSFFDTRARRGRCLLIWVNRSRARSDFAGLAAGSIGVVLG